MGTQEVEVVSREALTLQPQAPPLAQPLPRPWIRFAVCVLSLKDAGLPTLPLRVTNPNATPALCPLNRGGGALTPRPLQVT